MLRIFMSRKIHRPQPDLNPQPLDLETSMLPQDHRGRLAEDIDKCPIKLFLGKISKVERSHFL